MDFNLSKTQVFGISAALGVLAALFGHWFIGLAVVCTGTYYLYNKD